MAKVALTVVIAVLLGSYAGARIQKSAYAQDRVKFLAAGPPY